MWKTVKLGDFAAINYGFTAKASHESGAYKFLRITDIQGGKVEWNSVPFCDVPEKKIKNYLLYEGDIVFARTGATTGKSFIVTNPQNSVFASYLIRVSVNRGLISPKFISYFFQSKEYWEQVNEGISGAAQGGFNASKLADLTFPLPPLAEQERIVAKLDAAFAEIDEAVENLKNKKMNLKKLTDSVLERFFNNESFDEYELKDVCTFVGGSQPPKSEFEYEESENNIRLIQIRDYKSDRHIVYIPKDKARRFCTKDDVMIGRYGPPIFQILRGIEGAYNVALMKAIPKENILNDYLFYFLKNRRIQNFVINKSSRAAGQSGVNKDALEPYIINLPSLDIQKNICKASKELELQDTYLSNLYKKKLDNLMLLKSAILAQELQSEAA